MEKEIFFPVIKNLGNRVIHFTECEQGKWYLYLDIEVKLLLGYMTLILFQFDSDLEGEQQFMLLKDTCIR